MSHFKRKWDGFYFQRNTFQMCILEKELPCLKVYHDTLGFLNSHLFDQEVGGTWPSHVSPCLSKRHNFLFRFVMKENVLCHVLFEFPFSTLPFMTQLKEKVCCNSDLLPKILLGIRFTLLNELPNWAPPHLHPTPLSPVGGAGEGTAGLEHGGQVNALRGSAVPVLVSLFQIKNHQEASRNSATCGQDQWGARVIRNKVSGKEFWPTTVEDLAGKRGESSGRRKI